MALLPPERGGRKPLSERLGVDTPLRGIYSLDDSSSAPLGGFAQLTNVRADGDVAVCRGGQEKRISSPLDDTVVGIIDTEGGTADGGFDGAIWLGLIDGFKFNESSDGSAAVSRVSVRGSITLTDVNTTPSVSAVVGNGAHFETSSNLGYLVSLTDTVLNFDPAQDLTVSLWMRQNSTTIGSYLIAKQDADASRHYRIGMTSSTRPVISLFSSGGSGNLTMPAGTSPIGTWVHLVFTYTSATRAIAGYVNAGAANAGTPVPAGSALGGSVGFYINKRGTVTTLGAGDIDIDELYFFNVVKGSAWREYMYNSGSGRAYPA